MDAIADSNLFFLEMNLKIFSLVSISGKKKNVCTGCPHLRRLLAVPPFQTNRNKLCENGIEDLVT